MVEPRPLPRAKTSQPGPGGDMLANWFVNGAIDLWFLPIFA
jgi:hypothetical protein